MKETVMRQLMRREAYDKFITRVLDAVAEYDKSGDHVHNGGTCVGDCVRCNTLLAIGYSPSWKDSNRQIQREHATRVRARRNARA